MLTEAALKRGEKFESTKVHSRIYIFQKNYILIY